MPEFNKLLKNTLAIFWNVLSAAFMLNLILLEKNERI